MNFFFTHFFSISIQQIASVTKFCHDGGLGISLEGVIDIENGNECRPHHYINSILSNGPVGRNGLLQKNDELLEVNHFDYTSFFCGYFF